MPAVHTQMSRRVRSRSTKQHRRDLQELHEEGYGREYTDRKVWSAEFDGKASQEHTRGQRPHSLACESVVEDKTKPAPCGEVRIRRIMTMTTRACFVTRTGRTHLAWVR